MSSFRQDLSYAWRALRRRPLLLASASGALAVGIGASTAVFSVTDAVLLRPLPFAQSDRLVLAWERSPRRGQDFVEVSYPDYRDWQAQARTFSALAIMPTVNQRFTLDGSLEAQPPGGVFPPGPSAGSHLRREPAGADEPLRIQGRFVSGNFFDVLGVMAAHGRTLTAADDAPGAPRVAVLGHGLWARRFGGDPAAVGRTILMDGTPVTIVGVLPPTFAYPPEAELWTPVVPAVGDLVEKRQVGWAMVVGRLADGVPIETARAELDGIVARLDAQAVSTPDGRLGVVTPLADHYLGAARTALPVLLGAVVLVLVLACANVSALLLARAATRRREMAVRLALGASRAQLARTLLAESALIALAGGTGGLLLSVWGLDLLQALVPADVPRLEQAALDARMLAFAIVLTAASALLAGIVPAAMASKPSLTEALADGARTAGPQGGHPRLRALLLAAEGAVALVLLAGAGLLVRTFENLRSVDLGYDARQVLTFELSAPPRRYENPQQRRQLYQAVLERIRALPGVVSSGAVLLRPLWGEMGMDWPFQVEGQSQEEALKNPLLNLESVTAGYFAAMRIPVLRGRAFGERDAEGAPGVVIVSHALARRYWPGQDAVGKRLKIPLLDSPYHDTWLTVVGVVGDARYRELEASRMDLYMSHLQSRERLNHFVVRTSGDPLALAPDVRSAVRGVDRTLAVSELTTMEAAVDAALGGTRFRMQLLTAFALAALLLAALGIYGVVAFVVGHRTREIGLRMALGARAADVAALVLRQGLTPVLAGLLAGVLAALALARGLSALLYGVAPRDPLTLIAAAAVLGAVATLACAVPAFRAARIHPAEALRQE